MSAIQGGMATYGDCQWLVARDRVGDRVVASSYHGHKEFADRLVAGVLLLLTAPLLAMLMALVRITSRGPSLFSQPRVGKNGRPFFMHKIRTMPVDAEAATGPVWGGTHDSRATRVGRVLRRLHLDELPQLFNVLTGEMSLVGPRPERPEFVSVLSAAIPGYLDRIVVRPGITGLAQLNLPADTDLDSVRRKVTLDREYISRATLWLDVRLVVCTALRVFKLPEHGILVWFNLQRTVVPPASSGASSEAADGDGFGVPLASLVRQVNVRRRAEAARRHAVVPYGNRRMAASRLADSKKPKPR